MQLGIVFQGLMKIKGFKVNYKMYHRILLHRFFI